MGWPDVLWENHLEIQDFFSAEFWRLISTFMCLWYTLMCARKHWCTFACYRGRKWVTGIALCFHGSWNSLWTQTLLDNHLIFIWDNLIPNLRRPVSWLNDYLEFALLHRWIGGRQKSKASVSMAWMILAWKHFSAHVSWYSSWPY